MSNSKKILSIVLAIVMMLNIFVIVSVAAEPAASEADYNVDVSFAASKLSVYPGETFTLTMTVGTNCYLGGLSLPVFYDKTVFAIEDDAAALTGSFAAYGSVGSAVSASEAISWPTKINGGSVDKTKYGLYNVNAFGSVQGATPVVLNPAEQTITVTMKVSESATVGSTGLICLEPSTLKTNDALTNKMTAYAYKNNGAETVVSSVVPNIVGVLPMNVADAKVTVTVIPSPESGVDLTGLQSAYDTYGQITDAHENEYLSSSWTPYLVARTNAADILSAPAGYTQEAVDAAAQALIDAFNGLKAAGETSDYTEVDNELARVPSEYALGFYTEASVENLKAVINNINRELPPTEQDIIDDYVTMIRAAVDALVPQESRAVATAKLTFDKTDAEPGDEVEVKLFLGTNYAGESLQVPGFYDANQFEYVDESISFDSTLAQSGEADYAINPGAAIFDGRDKTDPTWEPFWATAENAKYKVIFVDWYQTGEGNYTESLFADINEAFATFKLKVKDDATDGDAKAFLCESFIKDETCNNGAFFVSRDLDLDATNLNEYYPVGQTYDLTGYEASCTIAATPTLIASEGSDAVVDKDMAGTYVVKGESIEATGFVYGLEEGLTSLDGFVEATHMGDVNVEKFNDSEIGTGSIITVTKNDKTYETYIVIIFGDIDGDSYITASDGSDATLYGLGYGDDYDPYVYFAGDISVDEDINASDGSLMTLYYLGYNDIDQTTGEYIYC